MGPNVSAGSAFGGTDMGGWVTGQVVRKGGRQ